MTSKDKFQEELEQLHDPSILKDYADFQTFQKEAWKTLVIFADLCEANSIPYQLAYGSLLGAVRDRGQIPWDYDIDVFVPYSYRKKLVEVLKTQLPAEYYANSTEFNKKVWGHIIRIAPKRYEIMYLHVDVFFLISAPADEEERKICVDKLVSCARKRSYRLVQIRKEAHSDKRYAFYLFRKKLRHIFDDMKKELFEFEKICEENSEKHTGYLMSADKFAGNFLFPESMLDTTQIELDGKMFRIPRNYDEILTIEYGDYMKWPDFQSRKKEFLGTCHRIQKHGIRE